MVLPTDLRYERKRSCDALTGNRRKKLLAGKLGSSPEIWKPTLEGGWSRERGSSVR
jgi:hypothetical protein